LKKTSLIPVPSSENIESFYAELDRYMYAEAQEEKFPKEVNNDTKKIMES
jgi:hypothetical protein